jgi:hypothetical protein
VNRRPLVCLALLGGVACFLPHPDSTSDIDWNNLQAQASAQAQGQAQGPSPPPRAGEPAFPSSPLSVGPAQKGATLAELTQPRETHPRLLVRDVDLARLRRWAVDGNPIYAKGLEALAQKMVRHMDGGDVAKDPGGQGYAEYPTEGIAMLFAFMSLVSPSQADRDGYARRSRALLMRLVDQAAMGASPGQPFRDRKFSIGDRSRWHGAAFGLTVDWIYGALTREDKAKIRSVFLRWADELTHADTTNDNHPEPIGVTDDPRLKADRERVRYAGNNYYTAHLRNLGLMSLSFDAADDPDNKLRAYLKQVTGAWLYVTDDLLNTDIAGGLTAEGFEYGPQAIGYVATFLTAMATAGRLDAKTYGPQTSWSSPFWDNVIPAFLHSISPAPAPIEAKDWAYLGPAYSVAWYGDSEKFWASDPMATLGPLGIFDQLVRNDRRLSAIRWIETNVPAGGEKALLDRVRDGSEFLFPILYFMVFDPSAPRAADPRPFVSLVHFAPGIQRLLARTSWKDDASWFSYKLGWNTVDHQHGDGNTFELFRKGEWLTKERTGYGSAVGSSDYENTLALQNDRPLHDQGYRAVNAQRGSQWLIVPEGDGKLLATSVIAKGATPKLVYALGDATALYNSTYEKATDIVHASRSVVWLAPDRVVTYDRALSKTDHRFKRYWLCLPSQGTVAGNLMTMTSAKGQKLFVRSLLPAGAAMTVEAAEPLTDGGREPASNDPIRYRLRVEASGGPKSARFLHTVQGADGNAAPETTTLVRSTGGTPYEGAALPDVVVMFPVDVGPVASVAYTAPAGAKAHVITGLAPSAGYTVAMTNGSITITPGGDSKADSGGVLVIGQLP